MNEFKIQDLTPETFSFQVPKNTFSDVNLNIGNMSNEWREAA